MYQTPAAGIKLPLSRSHVDRHLLLSGTADNHTTQVNRKYTILAFATPPLDKANNFYGAKNTARDRDEHKELVSVSAYLCLHM